ncbi:MAG TPA: hypothetical protein VEX35_04780 [Allosphingosinicella sp.]|nr:hypothetical protein [Allosphingosinicella sp.]
MDQEYAAFHSALGELVREFTNFELHLAFTLSNLLGVDGFRARVILGSLRNFDAKRRLIENLSATFASDEATRKLTAVMVRAKGLARNRNMVVHQLGGVASRKNQLVFMSDVPDDEIGMNFVGERTVDIGSVRRWTIDAKALTHDLMQVFKGCCSLVFTSPKMHRVRPAGDGEKATPPQAKAKSRRPRRPASPE